MAINLVDSDIALSFVLKFRDYFGLYFLYFILFFLIFFASGQQIEGLDSQSVGQHFLAAGGESGGL
jgi:hypothetical protein